MTPAIEYKPANGTSTPALSHSNTSDILERSCDVCIIGGGIVGMFAALLLSRQGLKVQVYEKQLSIYPLPRAVIFSDEILREFLVAGLGRLVSDYVVQGTGSGLLDTFDWRSPTHGKWLIVRRRRRPLNSRGARQASWASSE
jgi:2-polyprenyl-6-methoxyphenol hydroxylase-like FAD-dependent oxidoreductase